jgi:hypothetical protein
LLDDRQSRDSLSLVTPESSELAHRGSVVESITGSMGASSGEIDEPSEVAGGMMTAAKEELPEWWTPPEPAHRRPVFEL